jgi:hypothetical protein
MKKVTKAAKKVASKKVAAKAKTAPRADRITADRFDGKRVSLRGDAKDAPALRDGSVRGQVLAALAKAGPKGLPFDSIAKIEGFRASMLVGKRLAARVKVA